MIKLTHLHEKKKINAVLTLLSLLLTIPLYSQISVNKEWAKENGSPILLEWFNSITTENNDLVTVGNTTNAGQGADIFTTRFNKEGDKLWEKSYNSNGTANDYGIALTEDMNGNIYVIGTTDNNTFNDYDLILLKYDVNGNLKWAKQWDSGEHLKDIGTGIITDDNGNILVCASSETAQTKMDYLILKFDETGALLWEHRYDKASLDDAPIGIDLLQDGNILVTGASASDLNNWDYTTIVISNNGDFLNEKRITISNSGHDRPLAFTKDTEGNIFITGKTSFDGLNYDITTVKINTDYSLAWTATIDFAGLDDQANAIITDENENVYIGGYVTKNNGAKAMVLIKYDSNGNEKWRKVEHATNPSKDIVVKAMEKAIDGSIYYASEETLDSGIKTGILTKAEASGLNKWRRKLNDTGNNTPTSIRKANDGTIYVTALKGATAQQYQTMRYSKYKQDTATVYNNDGNPIYKAKELIVRFKANAINPNFVNDTRIEYGGLGKVLTPQAYTTLMDEFGRTCKECNLEVTAIKIFKHLTPAVTSTTSRLGTTVPVPDFWTALVLDFDGNVGIDDIHEFFKTVPSIVAYSEPNFFAETASANDSLYNTRQKSLHQIDPNDDINHINVEEAWDIFPDAGYPFIRVGVLDDGIQFKHEDFGYDGTSISSSKIKGWDFESDASLTSMTDSITHFVHGTPCTGIIGALRNNETGIAGIAGGNMNNGNTGVGLYGLRIFKPHQGHDIPFTPPSSPVQYVYDAMVMSSIDSTLDYTYGLNVSSNSWRIDDSLHGTPYYTDTNLVLLREAVHFNNRMQVSFIACRGNEGYNSPSYPAVLDDDWVLSVGGSGEDGDYYEGTPSSWKPSYGSDMDVIAPSINNLVYTTSRDSTGYRDFNGTSAATPHAAGVVALLMSYLNEPVPSYKNLAPEDCERIIELSATDVGPANYDLKNGWGRLNAGKALRLVEKPFRTVQHFGTNQYSQFTKESTLESSQQVVYLKEQTQNSNGIWFPKGAYKVNSYRIDAEVEHDLPQEDSILYFWARPSMSTVFEPIKNDSLLPRERIAIDSSSFTQSSCSMSGYVYEMFDMSGNPLGWLPFDTTLSKAQFEYTILAKKKYNVGVDNEQINSSGGWVNLYPNPSTDEQTLGLFLQNSSKLSVGLYDVQGRLIKLVYEGKQNGGETKLKVDINNLSAGMYIYKIAAGDKVKSIQFIKQ